MDDLLRTAAYNINIARTCIRLHENALGLGKPVSEGNEHRLEELEELQDVLQEASAHCDPHVEVPWEPPIPLPF